MCMMELHFWGARSPPALSTDALLYPHGRASDSALKVCPVRHVHLILYDMCWFPLREASSRRITIACTVLRTR